MKFLEKDLEEIIFNSKQEKLVERGLDFTYSFKIKKRQLRIGNYGVCDIVGYTKPIFDHAYGANNYYEKPEITIIELKKDTININAFLQAVRYLKGVMRYLEKVKKRDVNNYHFRIVLIGHEINFSSDFVYLTDIINSSNYINSEEFSISLDFYTYNYDIDGIVFENERYYNLKNEGFDYED
jgi:hypothetical protein